MAALEERDRYEELVRRFVIDKNCRMMRLAEHCGFKIVTRDFDRADIHRIWYVPEELIPIVGCMAAVVE